MVARDLKCNTKFINSKVMEHNTDWSQWTIITNYYDYENQEYYHVKRSGVWLAP